MNKDKQRIAIAEACGHISPRFTELGAFIASSGKTKDGVEWGSHGLPDYLNDLNAMHEAEKALETTHGASNFCDELGAVILRNAGLNPAGHCGIWRKIHATASQRAEAFLRTIGKWEDEQ